MRSKATRTAVTLGSIAAISTLLLTGCTAPSASSSSDTPVTQAEITKAMNTPTTITVWSWVPNFSTEVKQFEAKYPKITVKLSNVGQGLPEYTKLRTAIKAGQGPDVAQIEYQYIPSFQSDLQNLVPYGADKIKADYVSSIWGQVSKNGAVYGIPQDFGPMGNLYRSDILKKAGVTAPTTWAEYATAAQTIKDKTGSYISDMPGNDPGQFVGLLWQAGGRPFGYDGKKTVTVNIDSAVDQKVASYWNTLIQKGLVAVDPDFDNDWYQGLASGKYAGWLGAAWGPVFLQGTVAKTSGLWTASPLPQYSATGAQASSFWGGSADSVLNSSKNKIAAAEFTKFVNHDSTSSLTLATKQSLFPPLKATLASPAFSGQKSDFFGGQTVNALYNTISGTVDPNFQWLPYMDYAYSSFNNTLGKAIADKTDLLAGLKAWQAQVVAYGKQQGFTVKTN
ncbi:MAG: multiple sugar transport system substrate-binding protein [Actinomycetota bacterium]|nr:multiple sugar transport system substrate-binding protein [Actinomycetota bacterium]